MPETKPREFMEYQEPDGSIPYRDWFIRLIENDRLAAVKIEKYLARLQQGNFSNAKLLSGCGGVWELVIDFGPGWRVYFAQAGTKIILLLLGGSKKSQQKDIKTSVGYWREFKRRNKEQT